MCCPDNDDDEQPSCTTADADPCHYGKSQELVLIFFCTINALVTRVTGAVIRAGRVRTLPVDTATAYGRFIVTLVNVLVAPRATITRVCAVTRVRTTSDVFTLPVITSVTSGAGTWQLVLLLGDVHTQEAPDSHEAQVLHDLFSV